MSIRLFSWVQTRVSDGLESLQSSPRATLKTYKTIIGCLFGFGCDTGAVELVMSQMLRCDLDHFPQDGLVTRWAGHEYPTKTEELP